MSSRKSNPASTKEPSTSKVQSARVAIGEWLPRWNSWFCDAPMVVWSVRGVLYVESVSPLSLTGLSLARPSAVEVLLARLVAESPTGNYYGDGLGASGRWWSLIFEIHKFGGQSFILQRDYFGLYPVGLKPGLSQVADMR
jgi:hypothetical protein